jgi:hypothetical protein
MPGAGASSHIANAVNAPQIHPGEFDQIEGIEKYIVVRFALECVVVDAARRLRITGKFTGNFTKFGLPPRNFMSNRRDNSATYGKIP